MRSLNRFMALPCVTLRELRDHPAVRRHEGILTCFDQGCGVQNAQFRDSTGVLFGLNSCRTDLFTDHSPAPCIQRLPVQFRNCDSRAVQACARDRFTIHGPPFGAIAARAWSSVRDTWRTVRSTYPSAAPDPGVPLCSKKPNTLMIACSVSGFTDRKPVSAP